MKRMSLIIGLIMSFGLLFTSCGGTNDSINNPNEPVNSDSPNSRAPGLPQDEEGPIVNLPGETRYQDQKPAPGEAELVEGNAIVSSAHLLVMESFPVQVSLEIEGELPTPCNKLALDISSPDEDNRIMVDIYSLINPAETCIAMIEPFTASASLPVDGLEDGTYEVWVNGELVGQFSYPG